jgi:hypothetical protein
MKIWIILIFVFLAKMLVAQDLGEERITKPQSEIDEEQYTDPDKMSVKVRPLSYLLVIPTAGAIGSFNGRLDYAFSRQFSVGLEGNMFYQTPSPFLATVNRSLMLSARLDFNYFFLKNAPESSYAEGLHFGPFIKAKYENTFNPVAYTPVYGQAELIWLYLIAGPLVGYQWVFNKVVIDQVFGVGAGPYVNDVGVGINLDARIGLYFGLVAF